MDSSLFNMIPTILTFFYVLKPSCVSIYRRVEVIALTPMPRPLWGRLGVTINYKHSRLTI
jgi:hypothetical protein